MTKDELQKAWELARDNTDEKIEIAMQLAMDARLARDAAALAQKEQDDARAALLAPRDHDARNYTIEITAHLDYGEVLVETRRAPGGLRLRCLFDSVSLANDYAHALIEGLTEGRENVTVTKVYL